MDNDDDLGRLFRTLPVGVAVLDRNLRFVRMNEWLANTINTTPEEHLGRTLEEVFPEFAPQLIPGIQQVLNTGEAIFDAEVTAPCKPGEQIRCLASYQPLEIEDGTVMQVSLVFQHTTLDRSADKQFQSTEEYLDAILSNMPAGIAILEGADFRYTRINDRLAEINGVSVANHLNKPLAEVLPDAGPDILPALQVVRETGKPSLEREFSTRLPRDPDQTRHFIDSFFPIVGERGEAKAVGVLVVDITERKRAEEALQKAYDLIEQRVEERTAELAKSNTALRQEIIDRTTLEETLQRHREELAHVLRTSTISELTATLAHEINQPLAAILLNAQAAKRLIDNGVLELQEFREILDDIINDNKRAAEVIRHMRSLIKKREVDSQLLDIGDTITDVVDLVRSEALTNGIDLTLNLAEDLPVVQGDFVQLQQVILNLILNGFDAMGEAPINERRLVIQATLQDDKNAVCVSVQDAGIGLNGFEAERLFEPFYTTKPEGLGMGLAINRSIIDAHGGAIWAVENPVRGATIHFTLPIVPAC